MLFWLSAPANWSQSEDTLKSLGIYYNPAHQDMKAEIYQCKSID